MTIYLMESTNQWLTTGLLWLWLTCNIGVVLLNKYLHSNYGFKYRITFTMWNVMACALLSYVAKTFLHTPRYATLNYYLISSSSSSGIIYPILFILWHMMTCALFSYVAIAWINQVPLPTLRGFRNRIFLIMWRMMACALWSYVAIVWTGLVPLQIPRYAHLKYLLSEYGLQYLNHFILRHAITCVLLSHAAMAWMKLLALQSQRYATLLHVIAGAIFAIGAYALSTNSAKFLS